MPSLTKSAQWTCEQKFFDHKIGLYYEFAFFAEFYFITTPSRREQSGYLPFVTQNVQAGAVILQNFQKILFYYLLQSHMQDKNEINCTCMSPFFNPSEKMFLVRKEKLQEPDFGFSGRRVNKTTDVKSQSQNKSHKKSLKKRSGSQLQTDIPPLYQLLGETHRIEDEWKNQPQNYDHSQLLIQSTRMSGNAIAKGETTHGYPNVSKQSDVFLKSKLNYHGINPKDMYSIQQSVSRNIYSSNNEQAATRLNQQKRPAAQIISKQQIHQPIQKHANQNETSLLRMSLGNKKERESLQRNLISQNLKNVSNTEEINGDSLKFKCIESKILQNKKLNNFFNKNQGDGHIALNQESKGKNRPRQIRLQKRFSKQIEVRMAESEEQSLQESTPSQVIGKGFDRTYQDIEDLDETFQFTETFATRSTNTKASELTKAIDKNTGPGKDKFGGKNPFKSAKLV